MLEMYFFAPCPLVCQETFLKCNYGIYQYLAASGQNGHIRNVPWGGQMHRLITCRVQTKICRYTLPLRWVGGRKVCISFRGVLSLCPPPPHESPAAALFLCDRQQWWWWWDLAATWVSVRQTQLCFNICNMYSNTVHLCIYNDRNVKHIAQMSGMVFFF